MSVINRFKPLLKDTFSSILENTKLTCLSKVEKNSLSIITFHRVLPKELRQSYPFPQLVVTPQELEWILSILQPHFNFDTVSNSHTALKSGDHDKPLLAITFDDGQFDNIAYGLPVLKNCGVPATFYIPTGFIDSEDLLWHDIVGFAWLNLTDTDKGSTASDSIQKHLSSFSTLNEFMVFLKAVGCKERRLILESLRSYVHNPPSWARLLTWDEVKSISANGHEIGSHATTHELLSHLSRAEQQKELDESLKKIESEIGLAPTAFCYPDGNYDKITLELVKASSYTSAVSTQWGVNSVAEDGYQLKRFDINSDHLRNRNGQLSKSMFQFRMSRFQPKFH